MKRTSSLLEKLRRWSILLRHLNIDTLTVAFTRLFCASSFIYPQSGLYGPGWGFTEAAKPHLCKLHNNSCRNFIYKCEIFPFGEAICIIVRYRDVFIYSLLEGGKFQCGSCEKVHNPFLQKLSRSQYHPSKVEETNISGEAFIYP